MKSKICIQCAKTFENEAWRAACDRCGDHVFDVDDPRAVGAVDRAYLSGWTAGATARNQPLARRRQAKRGL
jgi:hypothetical protein